MCSAAGGSGAQGSSTTDSSLGTRCSGNKLETPGILTQPRSQGPGWRVQCSSGQKGPWGRGAVIARGGWGELASYSGPQGWDGPCLGHVGGPEGWPGEASTLSTQTAAFRAQAGFLVARGPRARV